MPPTLARTARLAPWPILAVAVFGLSVEAALPTPPASPMALWSGAGRFCGVLGLWLWVAAFILILRPKVLEQAVGGLDRLYFLHHATGIAAYALLLAHPLALAVHGMGREMLPGASPSLTLGWLALLLLMAMLAATFWLPLNYRIWRMVHGLSAPAFVLGALHGLGLAWPAQPLLAALTGLGLVAALTALALRYLMGTGHIASGHYQVSAVGHPGPDVVEITLHPLGAPQHWQPGQFVFAAFFDGRHYQGCGEFHPYTIASVPTEEGQITLMIKNLGRCTRRLQTIEPGVPARIQGPYGSFLADYDKTRAQLWIAGGIGITPFLAAAANLSPAAEVVDLVHLHRPGQTAIGADGLGVAATRHPGLRYHHWADESSLDALWAQLTGRIPRLAGRQVFLCGPPPLVDGLTRRLMAAGIPREDLHSEKFDLR